LPCALSRISKTMIDLLALAVLSLAILAIVQLATGGD